MQKILVVDDQEVILDTLSPTIAEAGYSVSTAKSASEARARMAEIEPDLVLMDLVLPDGNGSDLVAELGQQYPRTKFVAISGADASKVFASGKAGAVDFLAKPIKPQVLVAKLGEVLGPLEPEDESSQRQEPQWLGDLDSPSPAMKRLANQAHEAAAGSFPVLLTGERGVGKEFLAQWIHFNSARSNAPVLTMNCAGLAGDRAGTELFGNEEASDFSGVTSRPGFLELAKDGTVLLKEVAKLDAWVQQPLVDYLDTGEFVRVGGSERLSSRARIIASTRDHPDGLRRAGHIDRGLLDRLRQLTIEIPPLRERRADLPVLIEQLVRRLERKLELAESVVIEPETMKKLVGGSWRGNLGELRSVLEKGLALCDGERLRPADIRLPRRRNTWKMMVAFPADESLDDVTQGVAKELILEAMKRAGSQAGAAKLLGISRHALIRRIKAFGVRSLG